MHSAQNSYRLPAEWEPHDAVWLGWPHNTSDWPGKFQPIPWVFAEMASRLATSETVRVVCKDEASRKRAIRILKKADAQRFGRIATDPAAAGIEFVIAPTNRGWTRDFMPAFVQQLSPDATAPCAVLDFAFNGWGKYADHELDNAAGTVCGLRVAQEKGWDYLAPSFRGGPITFEGGALDVNGRGTILASEECLLDPEVQVRNPGLLRADYEELFLRWFGAPNPIWLGRGIVGDDTHGHVDDFCRFVAPQTLLLCQEPDGRDPNHAILEENRERLESARLEDGARPVLVRLPMPRPLYFDGQRLPASYANFYIGNTVVLVPTFNDANDRLALGIIAEHFPKRTVIGIHAVDLVLGLGTEHCLTHEQPQLRGGSIRSMEL